MHVRNKDTKIGRKTKEERMLYGSEDANLRYSLGVMP